MEQPVSEKNSCSLLQPGLCFRPWHKSRKSRTHRRQTGTSEELQLWVTWHDNDMTTWRLHNMQNCEDLAKIASWLWHNGDLISWTSARSPRSLQRALRPVEEPQSLRPWPHKALKLALQCERPQIAPNNLRQRMAKPPVQKWNSWCGTPHQTPSPEELLLGNQGRQCAVKSWHENNPTWNFKDRGVLSEPLKLCHRLAAIHLTSFPTHQCLPKCRPHFSDWCLMQWKSAWISSAQWLNKLNKRHQMLEANGS